MPSQAAVGPAWDRSWRDGNRLLRAESGVRRTPLVARAALSPLAVGPIVGLYFTEKTRREHDNVVCVRRRQRRQGETAPDRPLAWRLEDGVLWQRHAGDDVARNERLLISPPFHVLPQVAVQLAPLR